ncbi:MAG: hypothetical protein LAP21_18460 [Acidobacteriia bacterium]|nr:hypothetical protein [Terriglobia bacterium]
MTGTFKNDPLLVRYILGAASPEERNEVEARYLANTGLFEELVALESDLIDAYARGRLSEADRGRFEKHFLVTEERRQRVAFAEALLKHVAAEGEGSAVKASESPEFLPPGAALKQWSTTMQLGLAALFLAMATWSIWVTIQNVRLRRDIDQLQAGSAKLQEKARLLQQQIEALNRTNIPGGEGVGQEQAGKNRPESSSQLAVLTLHAGIYRSSGAQNKLILFPGTRFVRLRLALEQNDSPAFGASIETVDGTVVWQAKGLTVKAGQDETIVDVILPAKLLLSGDYIVNLTAETAGGHTEIVNTYIFQVSRR